MPVTIVEVGKASILNYVGIAIIVLLILAVTCAVIKDRRHRRNEEGLTVVALILLFGSGFIGLSCRDIYASTKQDVNIAYVNTSYSGQFLLEGSFPKAEDLRKCTTIGEDRMLYRGNDLEKTIKGNKYYIFKLDGFKTDVESVEEIVEKYNKKYNKNIKTEDLVIVRSDRY